MREIVLDTETTGLEPSEGHRLVEIGAVELVNYMPTGRTYHQYIDPQRDIPEEVRRVHGLDREFLSGFPLFAEIADGFLEFIGEAPLVIHNAAFDMRFINAELEGAGRRPLPAERAIDSLKLAQARFPGSPNNLDALCKRFGVDATARVRHGALLDCHLLAEVYLHLRGGRQVGLELVTREEAVGRAAIERPPRPARQFPVDPGELAAHEAFLDRIEAPLWRANR